MDARCRIEMLGRLRVLQGDREIVRFGAQKTAGLLAWLAYHLHGPHHRDVVVEIFWPGRAPPSGRNNLNTTLSSLRHQLEPPGTARGTILRSSRNHVQLNPDAVTSDVADFQAALHRAGCATGTTERIEHLEDAHRLYAGELLPGLYEDWVLTEQRRLADDYFDAALTLATLLEHSGDATRAIEIARAALSHDPLREEAHGELMRLYAASGQPVAALRQFAELRQLLDEELGQSPSPATELLAERIEAAGEKLAPAPAVPPAPQRATPVPSSGTLTFLLTNVEAAITESERLGERFSAALARYRELLRAEFARFDAEEISETGDGIVAVLPTARDAAACAVACQLAIARARWPGGMAAPRVRMALYTGDVSGGDGECHDVAVHRASRVLTAGHGGQILCCETTATLLRRHPDSQVTLRDLGTYRLRDVPAPEKLFQLDYPDMPQARFPALRAEAGYPSHLPLQLTRFFGREAELEQLIALLTEESARLVTLTGPGGCGKTRLALHLAEQVLEAFEGAVWFVPLVHVRDPKLMAGAIAERLELRRSPSLEPLEQIVGFLSGRTGLLILDNLEQLGGAAGPLVCTLLGRLPALTCLTTSRHRLDVPGERESVVAPLPTPGADCSAAELVEFASARLFVDRAQQALPDFQVTAGNAGAVAALCSRLDGIPLALELAAARAQVLTPAQMVARLDHRFDLLVSRRQMVDERHGTLRAAIDWSYDLLAPELQHFLGALSVFHGGWELEAAREVCGQPHALDLLQELLSNSLVVTSAEGSRVRFGMLETVREYAREHVNADEWTALCDRHAQYFLALCTEAAAAVDAPARGESIGYLDPERENVCAALGWARESYEPERYARTVADACPALYHCGHWIEMRECLEGALSRIEGRRFEGAPALRASLEYELGGLALDMGDLTLAGELATRALRRLRATGDGASSAGLLNLLGLVHLHQGKRAHARRSFEAILRLCPDPGDRARALHNLARVASSAGDLDTAERLYQEALVGRREAGDVRGEAETLNSLGANAQAAGKAPVAREHYLQSLSIYRELQHPHGVGVILNNLAEVAEMEDDLATAICLYQQAEQLLSSVRSRHAAAPAEALARLEQQIDPPRWAKLCARAEAESWEAVLEKALAQVRT